MTGAPIRPAGWPDPRTLLAWAGITLLLTLIALTSRPLLPLDETRYVAVAWEMWLRGDFLVPFKNGEPYSHKPPLLFWLIHAGWWAFGVSDWWPRLLSPLLSFTSLLLTWRLAWRLWPEAPDTAPMAGLMLLSSLLWLAYSQALMFDVLVSFCALLGLVALVERAALPAAAPASARLGRWLLFALAVGLGLLAKGPAILLHLLPAALLAPWWTRHSASRPTSWGHWYAGVLLALLAGILLVLAWAIPAGQAGGEAYRNAIFWGQTANRMVQSFAHQRPVWWYLALLPAFAFPWLFWPRLLKAGYASVRQAGQDTGIRFLLVWFGSAFLAFSFISGKQPHYLLPELPALALLAAHALTRESGRPARPVLPALALLVFAALLIVLPLRHDPADGPSVTALIPAWSALVPLLAGLALLLKPRPPRQVAGLLALAVLLSFAWLHLTVLPALVPVYDVRSMAQALSQLEAQGRPLANEGKYHGLFHLHGRLRHPLAEVEGHDLAVWLRDHPTGLAVLYLENDENPAPYRPRLILPFRSGWVALVDQQAIPTLAGKPRKKGKVDPGEDG